MIRSWGIGRQGELVTMLESLRQGAGTIHELNLDGAFPKRTPYRPRELYAALKATPLYDPERGQWKWFMSEDQRPTGAGRLAAYQLLGVLVEAEFDRAGALQLYEKVKATPLYDPERGQWDDRMSDEQVPDKTERDAATQLVGVLAEAQFHPEKARALYEQLKATPLYDVERGQWIWSISQGQKVQDTGREADAQLFGVLVEAQWNKEAARVLYEELKATPLYDPERRQWNRCITDKQIPTGTGRFAAAQLLGVLVEAQFDCASARVLYEKLMATPLYDPERGQWKWSMSEQEILYNSDRGANAQLLGVLVEAKLLSALPRALVETAPPLPVMENW